MIGISSPFFSLTPFDEVLAQISGRFELWEIVVEGHHSVEFVEPALKARADSLDLQFQFHAPLSDINIASLDPDIRELCIRKLESAIAAARRLDVRTVTVHPGHYSPISVEGKGRTREMNALAFARLSKAAVEHGVTVALENMPPMWITYFEDLAEVARAVEGTELKICLDIGHAHIARQLDRLDLIMPRLANIHIHDNNGKHDDHLAPGSGSIDFAPVVKAVRGGGYRGNWIYECRTMADAAPGIERLRSIID